MKRYISNCYLNVNGFDVFIPTSLYLQLLEHFESYGLEDKDILLSFDSQHEKNIVNHYLISGDDELHYFGYSCEEPFDED